MEGFKSKEAIEEHQKYMKFDKDFDEWDYTIAQVDTWS